MKEKIAYYPTPFEIVDIMIELSKKISSTLNLNKEINILEPGFGQGAFFDKIIDLKPINHSLYGIELDESFYNSQRDKLSNLYNSSSISIINDDYLNYNFNTLFDVIIGNPPYITNDTLPLNIKNKIKELTGSGEGNIYYAFILKSIELLKNDGELIFILPYDFFFNTYAKKLRDTLINEGYFELIIDLGDLKIFNNAAPETVIFKWIKNKKNNNKSINIIQYINKGSYKDVVPFLSEILNSDISQNKYFKKFSISHFTLNDTIWSLSNFNEYNTTIRLSSIAQVGVGIVNGSENSFKISNDDLYLFNDIEKENCVKTFIKAKNLNDFIVKAIDNNKYIFIDNTLKDEVELKTLYPNIYKYLYNYFDKLSNRYISKNSNWFNYLAIRNKSLMDASLNEYKIIVPCLTRKQDKWFSITNLPFYIAGDVLMIKGNTDFDTFYLFAIFNSDYFNKFYKEKGPKKGNRIVFNQKILNEINIPDFPFDIKEQLVLEVQKMIKNNNFSFVKINSIINNII